MVTLSDQFYNSIFEDACSQVRRSSQYVQTESDIKSVVQTLLNKRLTTADPLNVQNVSLLLHLVRNFRDNEIRSMVLESSRILRKRLFGNKVSVMVPVEMSSFCSSNCRFCGWRKDNAEMIRLKLAKDALIKEIKFLAEMGFAHFELSSGDDLNLLRFELPELIASVKKTAQEIIPSARVSICVTPFSEVHYSHLARCGLDTVFTWQETYDRDTYYAHITSGPKAVGLKDDLSLDTHGDGYLFRMKSQENAIRAGLQAGLGVMLGISPHLEADILSSVIHGNALISRYGDSIEPLIIGMPIWNPITTPKTDNLSKNSSIRLEESDFELISAIYLLGFPDRHAWVFPNCRVSKIEQMKSILTAGCFTSTMVRLGPGAYLAELTNADIPSLYTKIAKEKAPLNKQSIMDGEQFTHTFDFHENYLSMFAEGRLEIVPDRHFLLQN